MLARIHQISMRVHDVDRATRFYRDTLGLPFLFAAPPRLAFFDCDGVVATPPPCRARGASAGAPCS